MPQKYGELWACLLWCAEVSHRLLCLQAIGSYAALLDRSSPAVGAPARTGQAEAPQAKTLAAAAGQAAASRSKAAAGLAILLAYISTIRTMGPFSVSSSHMQHMQFIMLPKVSISAPATALRTCDIAVQKCMCRQWQTAFHDKLSGVLPRHLHCAWVSMSLRL